MAEIVNLNRVKKQRTRQQAAAQSDANRAKHGQTLVARRAQAMDVARRAARLDGARLPIAEDAQHER